MGRTCLRSRASFCLRALRSLLWRCMVIIGDNVFFTCARMS